MNHSRKQEPSPVDHAIEELELPPLVDDQTEKPEQDVLEGALGSFEEVGLGDEDAAVARITEQEVVADLIATGEVSLLDDSAAGAMPAMEPLEMDEDFHQPEENWTSPEEGDGVELDELVVFEEESPDSRVGDDNGAEGPVEEPIEIDTSGWDELEAADEDEPTESIEEAMQRLGISLPPEESSFFASGGSRGATSPGECHFLGPREPSARVRSLAFGAAGPLAVGESVFQIAADGQFHQMLELHEIERAVPTSCFAVREQLFVGTRSAGLLTIDLKTRSVRPCNGWMSLGWAPADAAHGSVSTSILTYGLQHGTDMTVFVETDEGQIFASEDQGASWRGPLLHEKAVHATVNRSAGELVVVCAGEAGAAPTLQITRDRIAYDAVSLPRELAAVLARGDSAQPGSLVLEAAGATFALGVVGLPGHLWISLDHGATWRRDSSSMTVTALAIDPEAPSWLAAACVAPDGRRGCLKMSEDGGRHWKPLFDPFEFEDEEGQLQSVGAIFELDLEVRSADRRIFAISQHGVFEIVVPKQDGLH